MIANVNDGAVVVVAAAVAVAMETVTVGAAISWIPNWFQVALFTRPIAIEHISVLLFRVTIQQMIKSTQRPHSIFRAENEN